MTKIAKFNVNDGTTIGTGVQNTPIAARKGPRIDSTHHHATTSSSSSSSSSSTSVPHSHSGEKGPPRVHVPRKTAAMKNPAKFAAAAGGGGSNNNLTAEKAVKKWQKSCANLVRKLPFQRFVRHITGQFKQKVRYSEVAIEALQVAVEAWVVRRLIIANSYRGHVGRKGIKAEDLELVDKIEGPWFDEEAVLLASMTSSQKKTFHENARLAKEEGGTVNRMAILIAVMTPKQRKRYLSLKHGGAQPSDEDAEDDDEDDDDDDAAMTEATA